MMSTIKGYVNGKVQGVGYRYFVKIKADELQLRGYAKNLDDGRVEFVAQGEESSLPILVGHLKSGPRFAKVAGVELVGYDGADRFQRFSIR